MMSPASHVFLIFCLLVVLLLVWSVFTLKTCNTLQSVTDAVAQTGSLLHSRFMLWNSKRAYLNVHLPTIATSVLAEKRLVARFHSNMLMLPRHESIFCAMWFKIIFILFYFVNATVVHLYVLQRKEVPGFVMCLFMGTVHKEINYADKTLRFPVCWTHTLPGCFLPLNFASECFMKGLNPLHSGRSTLPHYLFYCSRRRLSRSAHTSSILDRQ